MTSKQQLEKMMNEERNYMARVMYAHQWCNSETGPHTLEEANRYCSLYEMNGFSVDIIDLRTNQEIYKKMNQWDEMKVKI